MTNEEITEWEHRPDVIRVLTCYEMGAWLRRRDERLLSERVAKKVGHWIRQSQIHEFRNYYKCSVCGKGDTYLTFNFCPHCGCRMVEPQESEE